MRLVRLPYSGWILRTQSLTLLVDPLLPGLHQYAKRVDAVMLANALDPFRRDDPLSFGVLQLRRFFLAHRPVIVPRTDTGKLPLVRPGAAANLGQVVLRVLGPRGKKAPLPDQVGFEVFCRPTGPRLVFGGWSFRPEWLAEEKSGVDVLVLPMGLPGLAEVVARVAPGLFLPGDVLDLPIDPKAHIGLDAALTTLQGLKDVPWALLAWGEMVPVVAKGKVR